MKTPRSRRPAAWTLAGILVAGLALRLWGIGHGLPNVYNLDEYAHFVSGAVKMFGGGYNPHYFQNPPAYTYLLHVVFAFGWGGVFPAGGGDAVKAAFNGDPTSLYLTARIVTALLGVAAAWLVYFVGRRLYGVGAGLIAAALLSFCFLTVHYSHLALNDVPTLVPLCIGLFGLAGIVQNGRLVDYLLAGGGLGLATATKYTAAALAVAIFVAWAVRAWDAKRAGASTTEALRAELTRLVAAGALAALAFVIANPFSVLDADAFLSGLRRQQRLSADVAKLGTDETTGWQYYAWTLTWGFGWIPLLVALGGAGLALRRDWRRALPFVLFALLVWLFMGKQERFYARWLMPVYPVLAVFAGYAVVEVVKLLRDRWPLSAARSVAVGATIAALVLLQPLVTSIHNDVVLTHDDTRDDAKSWLLENAGRNAKVAIELIGPPPYFREGADRDAPKLFDYYELPRGAAIEKYAQSLSPALLDTYVERGYCHVVTGSIQKGRALKYPEKAPGAVAYYRELARRGRRVAVFSPVETGSDVPRFNFDISYNWYPLRYERPGPRIEIFKLSGGRCGDAESGVDTRTGGATTP